MHLPRERELQARRPSDGGLLQNLRSIPERQFFKHGQKISLSEGYQSVRPLSLSASVSSFSLCPSVLEEAEEVNEGKGGGEALGLGNREVSRVSFSPAAFAGSRKKLQH